jgi:hypothetical protein
LFSRKSAVLQREHEDWSLKDVLLDTEALRASTSFERQSGTPVITAVATSGQQAVQNARKASGSPLKVTFVSHS